MAEPGFEPRLSGIPPSLLPAPLTNPAVTIIVVDFLSIQGGTQHEHTHTASATAGLVTWLGHFHPLIVQHRLVWISASALSSCVTLGESLNLSVLSFLMDVTSMIITTYLTGLLGKLNELLHIVSIWYT